MKTPMFLYVLLLGLTVVYSFNSGNYLYKGETLSSISTENFSINGTSYKLVKISGSETFLLKNNEPVLDAIEINYVLKFYYKSKYAPTDTELNEVQTLLQGYNASRNDGGRWKGREEKECRNLLLLDGIIPNGSSKLYCTSEAACEKIAQVFYYSAPYTEGVRQTIYYADAAAALKEFAYASNELGSLLDKSAAYLSNLNENNIKEAFDFIKNAIPKISADEALIEATIYRTPRMGDKADLEFCKKQNSNKGCFGLCPDLSFNETQLTALGSEVDQLLLKVGPYANSNTVSAQLLENTNNRLNFKKGEDSAEIYISKFSPLHKNGIAAIQKGDETISYVNNESFKSKVQQLKDADKKINESITNRNFTTIDANLEDYAALTNYILNESSGVFQVYNDTFNEKQNANALIFAVITKGELSSDLKEKLSNAMNVSLSLDMAFKKGLKPEDYILLKEGYQNVSNEVSLILAQQKEFVALSKFRSLSRKINNGLYDLASTTDVVKPALLAQNSNYIPIAFSLFSWLSLSAVAILIFIGFLSGKKSAGKMAALVPGIGLFIVLISIVVFSVALYFYLDKTSNSADVEEFLLSMNGQKNISIVLQLQEAPLDAVKSMKDCAGTLKSAVLKDAENRSVTMYEVSKTSCIINGATENKTSEECTPPSGEPAFMFNYSPLMTKPSFSAIFDKKAYLSGDAVYFSVCQIAAVFK